MVLNGDIVRDDLRGGDRMIANIVFEKVKIYQECISYILNLLK